MKNLFLVLVLASMTASYIVPSLTLNRGQDSGETAGTKRCTLYLFQSITILGMCILLLCISKASLRPSLIIELVFFSAIHIAITEFFTRKALNLENFLLNSSLKLSSIILFLWYAEPLEFQIFKTQLIEFLLHESRLTISFNHFEQILLILILLILIISFTNIFIRLLFEMINLSSIKGNNENLRIGRYIGSLERILTVLGVYSGAYEAVVALYAVKTAIRFKKAHENPDFAEYYFLGTAISALAAVIIGVFCKLVF